MREILWNHVTDKIENLLGQKEVATQTPLSAIIRDYIPRAQILLRVSIKAIKINTLVDFVYIYNVISKDMLNFKYCPVVSSWEKVWP